MPWIYNFDILPISAVDLEGISFVPKLIPASLSRATSLSPKAKAGVRMPPPELLRISDLLEARRMAASDTFHVCSAGRRERMNDEKDLLANTDMYAGG